MFDATRPAGERLFMTTNINNPDKRPDVCDHAVGVTAKTLHSQASEYSAAYDELAAFSNYFSLAIKGGFPEGDFVPGPAMGRWPDTPSG